MASSSHFPQLQGSRQNKVSKSEQRDLLSKLPDSLILVILSFLQMKDVVATTILSKRWRNLWTTLPCLDFWYHSYDLQEYRSFIYGALAKWNGYHILKFRIAFSYFFPRASDLDYWLLFAIEKKVPELSLLLGRFRDGCSEYCPPSCLYSCTWITKLSLSYCKLEIVENVQWDQLKSLTIEGSKSLSADAMNNLLSGAPQLEELNLNIRNISESFHIRSTSLKTLRFSSDESICFGSVCVLSVLKIWAPNLLNLEIWGVLYAGCLLYVPSLTNAVLYFKYNGDQKQSLLKILHQVFLRICHAKKFTLSKWCMKVLLDMKSNNMIVNFPNAKFLKLFTGVETDKMLDVLDMFPSLMHLNALLEWPEGGYLVSRTTATFPYLKTVEITWDPYYPSIFSLIQVMLENAHVLEKMVLLFLKGDEKEFISAKKKVLSLPKSSSNAQLVIKLLNEWHVSL